MANDTVDPTKVSTKVVSVLSRDNTSPVRVVAKNPLPQPADPIEPKSTPHSHHACRQEQQPKPTVDVGQVLGHEPLIDHLSNRGGDGQRATGGNHQKQASQANLQSIRRQKRRQRGQVGDLAFVRLSLALTVHCPDYTLGRLTQLEYE
jgi:hypothetical protein